MPNPFRRREYEDSPVQHTHPHFQKLMRWDSKFDWFCLACVILVVVVVVRFILSIPSTVVGWF